MTVDTDVAIVGFGPVGAALAALLGRRGIQTTVVERDADVFPLPRAAHIDHQGLRLLQEIGCLDALMPRMMPNSGIDFTTADGQLILRLPASTLGVSGLPASMYFFQPLLDRCVRDAASSLPDVDVRLETEMVGLEQNGDHVRLDLLRADGSPDSLTASWVVGCDGAWSPVREAVGITLDDLGFHERWVVVDVILERPLAALPDRAVTIWDPARPATLIPIPEGRFRFELQVQPRDGEPEQIMQPERILELIAPWVGPEDVVIERSAVYNFHGLVAQRWRADRVMVAGDAAHQMPPFLGQGMCSGLRDAANLAWKLDAVVRRSAPESILDTYELERRPHVSEIVNAAVAYGRLTCITDPVAAAERDREFLADPTPAARRLPFRLPDLVPGPLVREGGGELFVQPAAEGDVPRLDDVVGQRFLVASANGELVGPTATWWAEEMGALVTTVDELPGASRIHRWLAVRDAGVIVVRPDRYVLGTGQTLENVTDGVAAVLHHPEPALEPG